MGYFGISQPQTEEEQEADFGRGEVRVALQQPFRKIRVYLMELLSEIFPVTFRKDSAGPELLEDQVIGSPGVIVFYRLDDAGVVMDLAGISVQ